MHILVDYRPALRQRTGVGEYVHHLAGALVKHLAPDDRLTLFSSSWKDRLDDPIPGAARLDCRIPVRLLNLAWHRLEWPPVERLGGAPDVTWSLHPLLMPTRRAAQVVSLMDLHVFEHPEQSEAEIRRDYARLGPSHLARADAVVTISEYTRRRAAERFAMSPARFAVCYPGAPAWQPRPEPGTPGPILHVGTIEPRKNIPTLIRAYRELLHRAPGAPPLLFAGRHGRVDLAGEDLVDGRIRLLGYVSETEKLRLYHEASMVVVASTEEGFGIPAVEAMTLGVPLVVSQQGSLPEVVADAALLADPSNVSSFAAAMHRILTDGALRSELRTRGFRQAARFSWDASALTLLSTFRDVVAKRRASG